MNIQTVAENLRVTIASKEELLKEWEHSDFVELRSVAKYVKINIDELRRILGDVESCVAKDVEQSWRDNPDRSGGQFTQEEIDNANRW